MKKRLLSIVLILCMLLTVMPLTPIAATATTMETEGYATITLVSQCDWGDGSGYQMLLDSTAIAYGVRFGSVGPLAEISDSTEEVYSAFDYKIPADAGWTRDTQAVVHYGSSQTIEIPAGIYDFCITNPSPEESMWIVGVAGDPVDRADDFEFKAGMHYTFTTSKFGQYDGVTLTVTGDIMPPVISGIENGKTYCGEVKFQITDNVGVKSVTLECNDTQTPLVADEDGWYTVKAEADSGYSINTVIVKDFGGNVASCLFYIRDSHVYNWHDDDTYYWQECANCHLTTEKKQIPSISIDIKGADKACRMSEYVYSFEIPDGCKDPGGYIALNEMSGEKDSVCTVEGNVATITVPADSYGDADSFNAVATVQLEDGYTIEVSKTVSILNEHIGGTADCTHKAKCEVCGEEYGEVNADNHTTLKHIEAKAATTEAEGNIEYWHCEECGKYFSDKDGKNEIKLADTVIAKIEKADSPQTGDNSYMALCFTLLFISAGALAGTVAFGKKKKHFVK